MHGTADRITHVDAAHWLMRDTATPEADRRMVLVEGGSHAVLDDPDAQRVRDAVCAFVDERRDVVVHWG